MTKGTPSATRLIFNAIGCFLLAAICLPGALALALGLGSMPPPPPNDPDGPKALGLVLFWLILCGMFGTAALIDFLRAVKQLRALPKNDPGAADA
jgi:hypothetical protein